MVDLIEKYTYVVLLISCVYILDNWILPDEKFVISENNTSPFQKTSILIISDASVRQNGSYTCVAKNTLGFAKSLVRTYSKFYKQTNHKDT